MCASGVKNLPGATISSLKLQNCLGEHASESMQNMSKNIHLQRFGLIICVFFPGEHAHVAAD